MQGVYRSRQLCASGVLLIGLRTSKNLTDVGKVTVCEGGEDDKTRKGYCVCRTGGVGGDRLDAVRVSVCVGHGDGGDKLDAGRDSVCVGQEDSRGHT